MKSVKSMQSDPYIWLEEVESKQSLGFAIKNNEIVKHRIESQKIFKKIKKDALEIYNSESRIPVVSYRDGYTYDFWQDKKNVKGIWRRSSLSEYQKKKPKWDILLDLDKLSKKESENWVFKGAECLSENPNYCMLFLSRGGSDAIVSREYRIDLKRFISPKENGFFLPEAKGTVSWVNQDQVLFSSASQGLVTDSGYPAEVYVLNRGENPKDALRIFKISKKDMGVWPYFAEQHAPYKSYVILRHAISFWKQKHYLYLDETNKLIEIKAPVESELETVFKDQFIFSMKKAGEFFGKKFKQDTLVSVIWNGSDFVKPRLVWEPNDEDVFLSLHKTKEHLYLNTLKNVRSAVYRLSNLGEKNNIDVLSLPEGITVSSIATDESAEIIDIRGEGFLSPPTQFINGKKIKSEPEVFNKKGMRQEQLFARSKDGTMVPYFIIYPKNFKPNGKNPTLLYGYGGFRISRTPYYLGATGKVWLKQGGIYVLANIRGGGEYGTKWHESALRENKQRSYDDFIAIAEDLIRRKITLPAHLGISGGSNGGLLVGAVFTQRPDLFNAVLCGVPLLDMMRYHKLLAGASWMEEYGDPEDTKMREIILKYSPYQNLKPDRKYPEVFFYTSTKDDRVHPAHARKMVARMQEYGKEVLYYENIEGGHSAASNLNQKAENTARLYTFLMEKLF